MSETDECELCGDTGWLECEILWCTDDSHGGYCSCATGRERQAEETGASRG